MQIQTENPQPVDELRREPVERFVGAIEMVKPVHCCLMAVSKLGRSVTKPVIMIGRAHPGFKMVRKHCSNVSELYTS